MFKFKKSKEKRYLVASSLLVDLTRYDGEAVGHSFATRDGVLN